MLLGLICNTYMNVQKFGDEYVYEDQEHPGFIWLVLLSSCFANFFCIYLSYLITQGYWMYVYWAFVAMSFSANLENKRWTKILYGPIHWLTRFFVFSYYTVKFDITGKI